MQSAPKAKRHFKVAMGQNPGVVLQRTLEYLLELGFPAKLCPRKNDRCVELRIAGGVREGIRFLGEIRPHRLLENFAKIIQDPPVIRPHASPVLDNIEVGEMLVVDLTTTTKTFIAEGFICA